MRPFILAAAGGLCLIPSLAVAQERPQNPRGLGDLVTEDTTVAEVVVSRTPGMPADVVAATVIGRQEIELRQATEPADVLQLVPGLAVARSGAFGGLTAVRQRGAATDKTLVLIDGIPINDASQPSGGYDFSGLDLEDVARVEILSGPQGSLWGSDAIGGVVNFVTRQPDGWRLSAEGGSFGYLRGAGALGGAWEAGDGLLSGGLSASAWRADGLSQADVRDGATEADGAWAHDISGRADYAAGDRFNLFARARYHRSRTDTDGFPPPFFTLADTKEFAQSRSWLADVGGEVFGRWGVGHILRYSLYDIDRANLGGSFPSSFQARRQIFRYVAERGGPSTAWAFQAGAEYETNRASLSDGSAASIDNASAFLVLRVNPTERLSLTGSVRYDDPSDVGGRATARASAVWHVTDSLSFTAAWGQGFKTPTISQLACDFCFPGGLSVGLRPERAEGYEAGVRFTAGRLRGSLTAYHLEVRDQIDFSASFPFRYLNLDETRTNGVEANVEWRINDQWRWDAEYALTDAQDVGAGTRLLRVPEHAGSVSLAWEGDRFSGIATVRAESNQNDAGGRRPGFVVADLAGQYDLNRGIQLTARIENLANTHYQQALGYGEPGIATYVGVRLRSE